MATDIKLSRFNNTPWGFRLSGGIDFPHPLTVVRVARGSLADDAGLQPGDVLIRINDSPLQELTHAQAHDWLLRADFDCGQRQKKPAVHDQLLVSKIRVLDVEYLSFGFRRVRGHILVEVCNINNERIRLANKIFRNSQILL